MPPSGFNQKAINGLLFFMRDQYDYLAETYKEKNYSSELELLSTELNHLRKLVPKDAGVSNNGLLGLAAFVAECYKDLSQEIRQGHDRQGRSVKEGEAIDKELQQIGDYLAAFEI